MGEKKQQVQMHIIGRDINDPCMSRMALACSYAFGNAWIGKQDTSWMG